MKLSKPFACIAVLAFACLAGCNARPEDTTYNGVSLRPPGAMDVEGALPI